ncbi:unnamed protein product [Litomosoides sigmodontis]|uniref:BPTI/Kunitz inhibitor domain-containing protein n=1 Tax=Litomosoides sigmodontis TaxID=42156 RepID=A0A3P6U246_LITSI|nr:unnamed protein product [Litomosoides sigmodontis]
MLTAPIWACKLQCARRKELKLEKKSKNVTVKKTVCALKFDKNLRRGCKTFDWRPRFFYNQTNSKCEMFWYDASCSKRRRKATNMFYHRGACKRLCEQSKQIENDQKSLQRAGEHHLGQISAMFSQPYELIRSNEPTRTKNIFDGRIR